MKAVGADFNFLCGIFRSREKALVSRQKLDAIASARSLPEAASQMPEGGFGARFRADPGVNGIEGGFSEELTDIRELLTRFSPRADFTRLIFLPWDFHNLKAAVLTRLSGKAAGEQSPAGRGGLFGPEGEVSVSRLAEMAQAMEFGGLSPHLAAGLEQAWIAYYDSDKDSQCFELALDRQKQLALEEISRSISSAIHEHFHVVSDISAADVFFRAYFSRLSWKRASWSFTGHPDLEKLKVLHTMKVEDWGGRLTSLSRKLLQKLFLAVRTPVDASEAVARERHAHLASMTDWGYKPPSVEYAYYFLTRKLADLFNLRLVLLCMLNGIPEAEFRGRVNDAFI